MTDTMSEAQVALVKALFDQAVLDEQSAYTFKEIKQVMNDELPISHLNDLRTKGFVRNSGGSINKWWITVKAINFLGLASGNSSQHTAVKSTEDINKTAEITHCKTAQLAASLRSANDLITKLSAENTALIEAMNKKPSLNFSGYLLGDEKGVHGLQLYSEDERLVAIDTLDEAKDIGKQSCKESAYDFVVYALVPVGKFKSRIAVDWIDA